MDRAVLKIKKKESSNFNLIDLWFWYLVLFSVIGKGGQIFLAFSPSEWMNQLFSWAEENTLCASADVKSWFITDVFMFQVISKSSDISSEFVLVECF